MNHPLVSVIIPCYNSGQFVGEAVESVLKQDYSPFEILVIDDGSTDDSSARIEEFRDPRIHYHYQENTGVSEARNHGLKKASGTLVAFLDADDLYCSQNLSLKIEMLSADPDLALVHSAVIEFDSHSGEHVKEVSGLGGHVLFRLLELEDNVIHCPSAVVVRRDLIENEGGFDPNLSTSADWEMWTRLAHKAPFGYIGQPLVKYRRHPNQMHLDVKKMESDMLYAFNRCREQGFFRDPGHYRYCLAKLSLILSASYLGNDKNLTRALKHLIRSVWADPSPLLKRVKIGANGL